MGEGEAAGEAGGAAGRAARTEEAGWRVARVHRNALLLQLASAAERAELQALVGLDQFLVGELSPLELLIDPQRLRELLDRMEERGIRPLMSREGA